MRRSNRERIVLGALEVAAREGYDRLTFEAVAEHTGLTRGGVVYHFRNRESLIEAIADHLLDQWTTEALDTLGKPFEAATRAERIRALARSVVDGSILPGELAFMISGRPEAARLLTAWETFQAEWVGDPETLTPMQRIALLAVEGYWTNKASGTTSSHPTDHETLELLIGLAAGTGGEPQTPAQER